MLSCQIFAIFYLLGDELFLWSLIHINQSIVCWKTGVAAFQCGITQRPRAHNYTFHHPYTNAKEFLKSSREFECTCCADCARTRLSTFIVQTKYALKCKCTSRVFRIHHTRAQQIARLTRAKIWLCTGCSYHKALLGATCHTTNPYVEFSKIQPYFKSLFVHKTLFICTSLNWI